MGRQTESKQSSKQKGDAKDILHLKSKILVKWRTQKIKA